MTNEEHAVVSCTIAQDHNWIQLLLQEQRNVCCDIRFTDASIWQTPNDHKRSWWHFCCALHLL